MKDKTFKEKVVAIQKEFLNKEKAALALKKQDLQVRENLMLGQTKKRLSNQLLDAVEERIFKNKTTPSKDVQHFVQVLHEKSEDLKKQFEEQKLIIEKLRKGKRQFEGLPEGLLKIKQKHGGEITINVLAYRFGNIDKFVKN